MRNFYAKLLDALALQRPPRELDIDATILRVYDRMMRNFEAETADWRAPDFVELPYDTLDRAPLEALEKIYTTLELDGFETARPRFAAYLESVRSFRKNAFKGDARAVELVAGHCRPWIEKWGYETPRPAGAAA